MERGWQKDPKADADEDDRRKRGGQGCGRKGGVGSMKGCQADMCPADLNAAKPYHRRHKVCEQHAKALVVLVVGIRQRFCQQCSRFHELLEFDEAKRSCRRRLAGHNERRRKTSGESQAEASSSHRGVAGTQLRDMICGQVDERGRIQITLPESSSTYKHFHIR